MERKVVHQRAADEPRRCGRGGRTVRSQHPRRWTGLLLTAALLGGCGTDGATTPAGEAQPASPSCELPRPGGRSRETVQIADVTRSYELFVPSRYDGRSSLPLVFDLHGSTVTAADQLALSRIETAAERERFVVAAPEAVNGLWNVPGVPAVTGNTLPPSAPNDVVFLAALIDHVSSVVCVDKDRVFATGFSGDGRLVSQAGCDLAERLAAIAPVAGLRHPPGCTPRRPVPVLTFHGTADPFNPYAGDAGPRWDYGVEEAARRWAATNGCNPQPQTTAVSGSVERRTFAGCQAGATVELYVVGGGGHTWPGGGEIPREFVDRVGPVNNEMSATDVIWSFFKDHRLPR